MEAIYTVRHACISDTTELLVLMRELARFGGLYRAILRDRR